MKLEAFLISLFRKLLNLIYNVFGEIETPFYNTPLILNNGGPFQPFIHLLCNH